jgi:hypothetical protein
VSHPGSAWKLLERLIREAGEGVQFRGITGWRYKDLSKLLAGDGSDHNPGLTPGEPPEQNGGMVAGDNYEFDADRGWTGWGALGPALAIASTDKAGENHHGKAQGDKMFKTTWGQKAVAQPGKPRTDFERLPSAMDRYDVLMSARIVTTLNRKGEPRKEGQLIRLAYSPSIGSQEERAARLKALFDGKQPSQLLKRPQPHVPEPIKPDPEKPETMLPDPVDVKSATGGHMGMGSLAPRELDPDDDRRVSGPAYQRKNPEPAWMHDPELRKKRNEK